MNWSYHTLIIQEETRQSPKPANVGNSRRTSSNPQPRAINVVFGVRMYVCMYIRLLKSCTCGTERKNVASSYQILSQSIRNCAVHQGLRRIDIVRNRELLLGVNNCQARWCPCTGSRGPDSGPTPDPLSLCRDGINNLIVTFAFLANVNVLRCVC